MKKTISRFFIFAMTALLAFALCACQDKRISTGEVKPAFTFPLEKKITISLWMPYDNAQATQYDTLADHPFFKRKEEKTNIHINFIHPTSHEALSDDQADYKAMIASGDIPDMLVHGLYSYPGGEDQAIIDNIYIKLEDRIPVHMPNFSKMMRENQIIQKSITTFNKHIAWIPSVKDFEQKDRKYLAGMLVRKDMLEELQIDEPVTIDDWYGMLKKFSTSGRLDRPLAMDKRTFGPVFAGDAFLSAYGGGSSYHIDPKTGKVVDGKTQPAMLEYLTLMAKWTKEGLLNWDTLTDEILAKDSVGAMSGDYSMIESLKQKASNPNYHMGAVAFPVLKEGDKLDFGYSEWPVTPPSFGSYFLSASNPYPDESLKWIDEFFTEESKMESSWGILNEDYKIVDGVPQFIDKILKYEGGAAKGIAAYTYGSPYRDSRADFATCTPEQIEAVTKKWSNCDNKYALPAYLAYSPEEIAYQSTFGTFLTGLSNLRGFADGTKPLSEWDAYLESMNQVGSQQQIELVQSVYDRYLVA